MLGSCLIAIFMLTEIGPLRVITCSRGSTEVSTGSYPFEVLSIGREQHVPDSTNQSLFPENEGNFRGNQLLYGSIRPSPFTQVQERFARRYRNEPSPEILLTLHFAGIFAVFPRVTLTQTTLKITVSGRCACVCACVWLCIMYVVCCVVLYL